MTELTAMGPAALTPEQKAFSRKVVDLAET
jgi:hypothetical protein